jgi:hypothetical protein
VRLFGSIELGPLRLGASVRPRIFRRRRPRPYYIHYGCPIHHRSARTADRCPNGRI